MKKTKNRFIAHYQNEFTPWVHKKVDFNLPDTIRNYDIKPCKTLEIGCGTGTDAIWLARQGFDVTAVDVSPIAIKKATGSAEEEGVKCNFKVLDFLGETVPGGPYNFIFDRGYFHSYRTRRGRKRLAGKVAEMLADEGLWLSLIGSADSPPRQTGPPMHSAKAIVIATEKLFEIQLIKKSFFGSEQEPPANIWVALFKKRK